VIQERENELVIGTHGRSIWVLDIDLLLNQWPADVRWVDSAPNHFVMDTLAEVTWSEKWGEKGWSWNAPTPVTAQLSCFSPEALLGSWLAEDSTGQRITLSDSASVQKGWQQIDVPIRIAGTADHLGIGAYQLIWKEKGAVEEQFTKLTIQAAKKEEEDE